MAANHPVTQPPYHPRFAPKTNLNQVVSTVFSSNITVEQQILWLYDKVITQDETIKQMQEEIDALKKPG